MLVKKRFTLEEDNILIDAFLNKKKDDKTVRKAAARIGRNYESCARRLRDLGYVNYTVISNKHKWTEAELQILEDNAHQRNTYIQTLLRKNGYRRSVGAIIKKKSIENIRWKEARSTMGIFSAREVAEGMNVDVNTVMLWIRKGWLKCEGSGVKIGRMEMLSIQAKDVRRCIKAHLESIPFHKANKFWVVDILTNS